jgi:exodeoxyribonuclease VIII
MWKQNLESDVYHAHRDYLSSSDIRKLLRSPAHYRAPSAPASPAQEFGTLVHTAVLEPALWAERFKPAPKYDRRTKEGKLAYENQQLRAVADGISFISEDTHAHVERLAASVHAHLGSSGILTGGLAEVSGFTEDFDGIKARIRPDYLRDDLIIDLKTTVDARPEAFLRSVMTYQYHVQMAWYLDIAKAIDGKERRFLWVVVEKEAPFGVAVYEPTIAMWSQGWALYRKAIQIFKDCDAIDDFPCYTTDVQKLDLPKWAQMEAP